MIESVIKLLLNSVRSEPDSETRVFCRALVTLFVITVMISIARDAVANGEDDSDTWYRIKFDGKSVGYEHVRIHRMKNSSPPVWSCYRKTQLHLKRIGKQFSLNALLWTEQLDDGQLLSFHLERQDGDNRRLKRIGRLDGSTNIMQVSELQTGSRRNYRVDIGATAYSPIVSSWMPGVVGPTVRRKTTPVFFPEADGAANIVTEYRASQRIEHGGAQILVSRQNFYSDGDPSKLTTLIISSDGRVLRQEKRVFGGVLAMIEAPADVALQSAHSSIDIDSRSLIPVDKLVRFSPTRTKVRLALSVSTGFLPVVPDSKFQQVQSVGETEVVIALSAPQLSGQSLTPASERNHPALASSVLIPVLDKALQKLATKAAGPEKDPLKVCQRLESFVGRSMRRASFSTSIVPANEVVKSLRGDCTEHAVLLTSLMRIKGVPARVASGLIQTNGQLGFQGHMWVEALLDGEWLPFDSTADRKIPRIKLADSELPDSETSGIGLFLPVIELTGRATLRLLRDDDRAAEN